jgi:REP element-mobilizing transposase RayT
VDPGSHGTIQLMVDTAHVINKRHGAYLPHWSREAGTYAVTFHLADSVPSSVQKSWRFERENIVKTARQMNRPLSSHERKLLARLVSEKIDHYLNAGHGACHMKNPGIAKLVSKTLGHFNHVRYSLACWCIMPNHVHAIIKPLGENTLSKILHSWKSFTALEANRLIGRRGAFWESEYYDHLIQDEDELEQQIKYILDNPLKAGLAGWEWVWVDPRFRL